MKLIFYSPQTLPSIGGLQYVVHYWAEALTRLGHEVTVITETPDQLNMQPDRQEKKINQTKTALNNETSPGAPLPPLGDEGKGVGGVRVLRIPSFGMQVRLMRTADRIIMFNVSLKGLPAVQLSGKPLYISHHTALWYPNASRPLRQRMKQWVANKMAKGNCACSGYIAGLYHNCRVIHSPFRADLFFRGAVPRLPGAVVFAGRLVSDKGVDLLIEAFARLVKSTQTGQPVNPSTFQLTIIGDGPEKAALQQQAIELGIEKRVHWLGMLSQKDLVEQMQQAEIMVVPSRMEPMGMVVAEGLAIGCRMVVSNQGGLPEVGDSFCRYFESENVESLVEALRDQLLQPLPVAAESLQKHLEKFSIEYTARQLEDWLAG